MMVHPGRLLIESLSVKVLVRNQSQEGRSDWVLVSGGGRAKDPCVWTCWFESVHRGAREERKNLGPGALTEDP